MKPLARNIKRCLIVCSGAYHADGGIAAVNRLVIQAVLEADCQTYVLVLTEADDTLEQYYDPPGHFNYQVFHGNKVWFTLSVWQALVKHAYEYVFVDHVNLASILAPLAALRRCRYIVWLCGIEVFPPRPDWEGRLGLRYAWKRLAISGYTQSSVAVRFPRLPIRVCDLALDPIRHALTLPEQPLAGSEEMFLTAINGQAHALGQQVILNVARMVSGEKYKGQDCLISAFPRICQAFPDAQLVLVGQGDDRPRLEALARNLPGTLASRVFMPGYVSYEILDRLYRNCYLFAMPSAGEGFGLVYLEAMSRAKSCLGGRVDATPWVVRDGSTGILVDDPRSSEQVADKITWLLAHPQEAQQMGRAGYELVRSYYLFPQFKERFWKAVTD
jgi:phosphatidylinositol alpha-1,6-mannosyltransferase